LKFKVDSREIRNEREYRVYVLNLFRDLKESSNMWYSLPLESKIRFYIEDVREYFGFDY